MTAQPVGVMPLSGALPTTYPDPDPDPGLSCNMCNPLSAIINDDA